MFSIRSRGMIELGFEVDIALPKGSALYGLVTVEGIFMQLIRLRPASYHISGCFYRPSICKINEPRMLPRMLISSESRILRIGTFLISHDYI